MKYFGTVKSFDSALGSGLIKPETSSDDIQFSQSAIAWSKEIAPVVGQRLSYDIGRDSERQRPCALNLQTI